VIGNMDRSYRNPNLLEWRGMWLIDHGATLSFHHRWSSAEGYDAREYDATDHVLIGAGADVDAADAELGPRLTDDAIASAVSRVPDEWLDDEPGVGGPAAIRAAYSTRLRARLDARPAWLPDLIDTAARRGGSR